MAKPPDNLLRATAPVHELDTSIKPSAVNIETFILSSRWLLLPFYIGLYIVMMVYACYYVREVFHFVISSPGFDKNTIMMGVLEAVDVVMIANLVKMIITGSYNSFVSKFKQNLGENVSSGMLKVKMGTSLIGVSSINMLQTFITANMIDWETLKKQVVIHVMFLIGAIALAYIDYLHEKVKVHV
jgi:uncharacterized protein (TIGR00645 family)